MLTVTTRSSPRKSEKGQQPQKRYSIVISIKLTRTYEVDSAMTIERICLERDGHVPKADRKNASESWKHIHASRPTARGVLDDQEKVKQEEVEVVSLFAVRMDIYKPSSK
ncbi:hypothetical protein BGZ47_006242 [Haplosporangium gracile]|nr:hypothetical protein BGZ47_006242 [Haplosporangium gracile]